MPHSFLLRRLSFTILSAVDSFTKLLLSCESHIPPSPHTPRSPRSPRSPRPTRRKRPLLITPASPTSVNPHHSPTIPYSHSQTTFSIFDYQPPLRRSRTRHHNHHPTQSRTSPKQFNYRNSVHPRLSRREFIRPSVRQQSHRQTQRQEKRIRVPSSHHERLAFVGSPPNHLPSMEPVNPCRRNRNTVNRVAARQLYKHVQPHPPVAPIALPPTVRHLPRGTLTSFLTTDDTDIFRFNQIEAATSKDPLLEQGIRPSRRVRFAQNVQLVC